MATEQVLALEKQVTDFTDMYKSAEFPPEFFCEISELPTEDASSYMIGHDLIIDGGYTIR